MMRYNTDIGVHEQYNGATHGHLLIHPILQQFCLEVLIPNVAKKKKKKTLTIVGDRFDANATVSIGGSLIQASDTTFVNPTTNPKLILVAEQIRPKQQVV